MSRTLFILFCALSFSISARGQRKPLFTPRYVEEHIWDIDTVLSSSDTIILSSNNPIFSLSINGRILQPSEDSFVRVVMKDSNGIEYLVAESNWYINDSIVVDLTSYCEETRSLNGVSPRTLMCYLSNATLQISSIGVSLSNMESSNSRKVGQADRLAQVQNTVERINAFNYKHKKLWKAGVTQKALRNFNDRRNIDGADTYLSNMKYYVDGIYEIGNPQNYSNDEIEELYVDSFDWRSRHGRNWITPAKNQEDSNWCSVFAAVSGIEAAVNLYFNQNINLDLSEQDVANQLKFTSKANNCNAKRALDSVAVNGIIDEASFPTTFNSLPAVRPTGIEKVWIDGIKHYYRYSMTPNALMNILINEGPVVSGYQNTEHHHAMLLVGYKKIVPGMRVYMGDEGWVPPSLAENDFRIGQICWIFKDNYYGSPNHDPYEDRGCMFVFFYDMQSHLTRDLYTILPQIVRQGHSDAEIVCEDHDGDGFYYWGNGPKPSHCPDWVPDEPDGDDSDYSQGPMNSFGQLKNLNPDENDTIFITSDSISTQKKFIYNHTVIANGGSLKLTADAMCYKGTNLVVNRGGKLLVENCTLNNVNLIVNPGGKVEVREDCNIKTCSSRDFSIPLGATLEMSTGCVKP